MAGLRRICKMYGQMRVGDTLWLWDYANDEPIPADQMKIGTERRKVSDIAKAELMRAAFASDRDSSGEAKHG